MHRTVFTHFGRFFAERAGLGLVPVLALALGGCFGWGEHHYRSYCDSTGCYRCDENGCAGGGGGVGSCTSSRDCAEGCYCDAARRACVEAGFCDSDSDCGAGFQCNERRHSCEPAGSASPDGGVTNPGDPDSGSNPGNPDGGGGPGTCSCSADCASLGDGYVCDLTNHTCKPAPDMPPGSVTCSADCDCPSGQVCANGTCTPSGCGVTDPCTFDYECGQGQCVNGQCRAACTSSSTCGTGDTCQTGHCAPNLAASACVYNTDCGSNRACVNGTCHATCSTDTDCANPADTCDCGLCRPNRNKVPQCRTGADCAAGEDCVNAVCRTPCASSSDCGACIDQPICALGYCSSQNEAHPQCHTQADCGAGQSCVNALCK